MRRLRFQLIGLLLLVALLPAVPAAWTVRDLFHRSLTGGGEEAILKGARAGLDAARELLDIEKTKFADRILENGPVDTLSAEAVTGLDAGDRQTLETALAIKPDPERPDPSGVIVAGPIRMTLGGEQLLAARIHPPARDPVWVTTPLSPVLIERAGSLTEAIRRVETLRRDRKTIERGLVFTFLAVYGVILALVIILGLWIASRLTRPLEQLGLGIDRVAGGNLDARIETSNAGHLTELVSQFNHMTERLSTQQDELIRLEKLAMWRNLARRLAHEIKNPLTPIQLATQQIRDAYPGSDTEYRRMLDEGVEIVEEEVRSLRNLVREFSEFARLPKPRMRQTSVDEMLNDLVALYREDKIRIGTAGHRPGLAVWCDPGEIHRVFINLINNALHAQEEAESVERVELAVQPSSGGFIVFEIRDRGSGISKENRRRIFAPDFSTKSEGMGLGLAIVEGIVHAHGGSIEAIEREEGGTTFRFALPADADEAGEGLK